MVSPEGQEPQKSWSSRRGVSTEPESRSSRLSSAPTSLSHMASCSQLCASLITDASFSSGYQLASSAPLPLLWLSASAYTHLSSLSDFCFTGLHTNAIFPAQALMAQWQVNSTFPVHGCNFPHQTTLGGWLVYRLAARRSNAHSWINQVEYSFYVVKNIAIEVYSSAMYCGTAGTPELSNTCLGHWVS